MTKKVKKDVKSVSGNEMATILIPDKQTQSENIEKYQFIIIMSTIYAAYLNVIGI